MFIRRLGFRHCFKHLFHVTHTSAPLSLEPSCCFNWKNPIG